uniref:Low-density lipoprotein receptor-related protein 5-like n=1 Tax=Saccoglossus kowalevskii TaxID=10224 RepID=A0ABM0GJF3_SACKO|nr:PREDICTED: low-density lipoprotein receptor-related protein 5-like [Saccoglossus kowalevskii]
MTAGHSSIPMALGHSDGQMNPPSLVWVAYRSYDAYATVRSLPADPEDYISSPSITSPTHFSQYGSQWAALDNHFSERVLYFSDLSNGGIIKGKFDAQHVSQSADYLVRGTSVIDGIAIDWISGNVYWSDMHYNWIKVTDSTGSKQQIVIKSGLDIPRAVVVYPQRGLLFWTDWGSEPKIEKSNLAGYNRQTLVHYGLVYPNGLAIDYQTNRLYWINVDNAIQLVSTISSCDFDGNDKQELHSESVYSAWYFDLTIYEVSESVYSAWYFDPTIYEESVSVNSAWYFDLTIYEVSESVSSAWYFDLTIYEVSEPVNSARYFDLTIYEVSESVYSARYFDLTIYENYVFVSDWAEKMKCIYKDTGVEYFGLNTGAKPFGVSIYGDYNQPTAPSACADAPCSDLCVTDISEYTCLCTEHAYLLDDGRTCQKDNTLQSPLLIWSTTNSICTLPVHMGNMHLPNDTYNYHCLLSGEDHVVAIDADIHGKFLYYSDYQQRVIKRARLVDGETTVIINGGIGSVEGIAIDWINFNLYWTDNHQNHIAVSRLDGSYRKILITNLDQPRSIVVDPINRYMYWGDYGTSAKIERAGLDGTNRITFISGLIQPMGLAIDFSKNSKLIVQIPYLTTLVPDPGRANKVKYGVCGSNNGGCSQLCLPQTTSEYRCECSHGFTLHSDGITCIASTLPVLNDFIFLSDPYLHGIFQVDLNSPSLEYTALSIDDIIMDYPHAVDYDPVLQQIYWTDVGHKCIYKANLNDSSRQTIVEGDLETPQSIAVDYISGLLYWSDSTLSKIEVAQFDGSNRKTLITSGLTKPRQLTVDPLEGYIYWSDVGNDNITAAIGKSYMDGSNVQIIISTEISKPAGLVIDYSERKLYWCDYQLSKLEKCDLDGENRVTLIQLSVNEEPFSLVLSDSYIYWSDWRKHGLMRADKSTGNNVISVGYQEFNIIYHIHLHSQQTMITGSNGCSDARNGGCSSLCLPTPTGRSCDCPQGVEMKDDGTTCHGVERCPADFSHGSVRPDCITLPGYTCTIQCDPGYQISSSDQITCLATGQWDTNPSVYCVAIQCSELTSPVHSSTVSCPQPLYGSSCIHQCDVGYVVLSGNEERICQANGTWSGTTLVCQSQPCPPLMPPTNGFYTPLSCQSEGGSFNDVCQLSCQQGYQLEGVSVFISQSCLATGEWSSSNTLPMCQDVAKPVLANCPLDMTVMAARNQQSAIVSWAIPSTTDNSGEVNLTHSVQPPVELSNGQHAVTITATDPSGNSAVCQFTVTVQVIDCGQPLVPLHATLLPCTTHYGSTCTITCNIGYAITGSGQRSCEIYPNRQPYWSGTIPRCNIVVCPAPHIPPHVVQSACIAPFIYNSVCTHRCDIGYDHTSGNQTKICLSNGTWSGESMQCTVIRCVTLSYPLFGSIEDACTNHYGSLCTIRCNTGYNLVGSAYTICESDDNENGYWTPHGLCQPCDTIPSDIIGCDNSQPWLPYNTICQYQCNLGYQVTQGSTEQRCQADGTWDGTSVVCQIKTCNALAVPPQGILSPSSCHLQSNYSDECVYTCRDGYQVIGPTTRLCLHDGTWSHSEESTTCQDIEAPTFTCPPNMLVVTDKCLTIGLVNFTHPIAHDNEGVVSTTGPYTQSLPAYWDIGLYSQLYTATDEQGNIGQCQFTITVQVVACPPLSSPANGVIESQSCGNSHGSVTHFQCFIGYNLIGSTDLVCGIDGTWQGVVPLCQAIMCPTLSTPAYGVLSPLECTLGPVLYGTVCNLYCYAGFELDGIQQTTCSNGGIWSHDISMSNCTDIAQPRFGDTCPPSTVDPLVLPFGSATINASWEIPIATDNSDEEPPSVVSCNSTHLIESKIMPAELNCPDAVFADNVGVTVRSDRTRGRLVYEWDDYVIIQTATDDAGNQAICNTTVSVVDY